MQPRDAAPARPIARFRRTVSAGYELDTNLIVPSLTLQAGGAPFEQLRHFLKAVQAEGNALCGFHREPSKNIIEFRSGGVASFWLWHTANEAYPALSHLFQNPQLHPERLFKKSPGWRAR